MDFTQQDILITAITLLLLISIVYFKLARIRYMTIGLYILFAIYVFYNIDKRYSLGMLSLFILTYMFVASKPILEHFDQEEDIAVDSEEPLENPQLTAIEEDQLAQSEEKEQEGEIEDENIEEDEEMEAEQEEKNIEEDETEETGIEQFNIEDRFTQLHGLLHKISDQAKKGSKKI